MNDEEATAMAVRAAEAWGGLDALPRLIRNRENIVFEVHLIHGGHAALRLHRAGYQTRASIEAELIWTEQLAQAGFPCPRPLRTRASELTTAPMQGPTVSAVSWIAAEPIGENGVMFQGGQDAHCTQYREVGKTVQRLHAITATMSMSNIARPSWDIDGLLGDAPLWGRFWENPALNVEEAQELQTARQNAAQHLMRLDSDLSLIHADLLQENILQNDQGIWLIDFDDSGHGFRGYDLGTALIQHAELDYLDALEDALCDGYGADAPMRKALPLFTMLRSMASCGWIISRAPADDPRQRFYAKRALNCAQRYGQTTTSSSA